MRTFCLTFIKLYLVISGIVSYTICCFLEGIVLVGIYAHHVTLWDIRLSLIAAFFFVSGAVLCFTDLEEPQPEPDYVQGVNLIPSSIMATVSLRGGDTDESAYRPLDSGISNLPALVDTGHVDFATAS